MNKDINHNHVTSPRISWPGVAGLSSTGFAFPFIVSGGIYAVVGTIGVPLFIAGFLIAFLAAFGWLKLVLAYPDKVGGITVAAANGMRPYSQVLGTIIGIGYWIAWAITPSFAAEIFASTLQQWLFPGLSVKLTAILLIMAMTGLSLVGLRWACRVAIPCTIVAISMALLSVILPIYTGQVNWSQAFTYHLTVPFVGGFGVVTSLMAGLYLVGWVVPAFEASLCYVGEMDNKNKRRNNTIAFSLCTASFFLTCCIIPVVWFGVFGVGPLERGAIVYTDLTQMFIILGEKTATLCALAFFLLNALLLTIASLCLSPRTLAQLAEDGFAPRVFGKRALSNREPWVAILATSAVAITVVIIGSPGWLMAGTNFSYLLCVSVPSIVAYFTFREKGRFQLGIFLGLISAGIWMLSTILGFQQYTLPTVIAGIAFAFSGALFLIIRNVSDRLHRGLPWFSGSLQVKLTGTMLLILILDSLGYLVAVNEVVKLGSGTSMVTLLEDIFVFVAILSLSIGLIVPGMIVTTAENISQAARRLARDTIGDFSKAMMALGRGDLEHASAAIHIEPLPIYSHDELGEMADSFNLLQVEVLHSVEGLKGARENLIHARQELLAINESLEQRVAERTQELSITNAELKKVVDELTMAKDRLVETEKMAALGALVTGVAHEVGTPLGIAVTAVSQLKEEISTIILANQNKTLSRSQLTDFLNISEESEKLIEVNLKRAVNLMTNFKQVSADQASEMLRSFSVKKYLEDILMSLKPVLKETNIATQIDCPENLVIESYPGVIFQIITIFVMNTLMHGFKPNEEGKIFIQVTEEGDRLTIQYTDTGAGIPEENLTRIFEPFFTTKRGAGGIGLGLNIAYNRAVNTLHGSLHCESILGKGATFVLIFPIKRVYADGK